MEKEPPILSIVIPTYNEVGRLAPTLTATHEYLALRRLPAEIIIADDGSTDGTLPLAASLLDEGADRLLPAQVHVGKGDAVRRGMLAARGQCVLFMDADLCTPIETLDQMMPWLYRGYDIVIGTRHHPDAHIAVLQPRIRRVLGSLYVQLANFILSTSHSDISCGFKLFRQNVIGPLFSLQKQTGWCFDAEILFLAQRAGYLTREVPIVWRHRDGSKTRPFKDVFTSFLGLLQIRFSTWNHLVDMVPAHRLAGSDRDVADSDGLLSHEAIRDKQRSFE